MTLGKVIEAVPTAVALVDGSATAGLELVIVTVIGAGADALKLALPYVVRPTPVASLPVVVAPLTLTVVVAVVTPG